MRRMQRTQRCGQRRSALCGRTVRATCIYRSHASGGAHGTTLFRHTRCNSITAARADRRPGDAHQSSAPRLLRPWRTNHPAPPPVASAARRGRVGGGDGAAAPTALPPAPLPALLPALHGAIRRLALAQQADDAPARVEVEVGPGLRTVQLLSSGQHKACACARFKTWTPRRRTCSGK